MHMLLVIGCQFIKLQNCQFTNDKTCKTCKKLRNPLCQFEMCNMYAVNIRCIYK